MSGPLAVYLGRIMGFEKKFHQVFITHFGRVKDNFHGFCVAGGTSTNFLIGRILSMATGVAHRGLKYAPCLLEIVFCSPEAAGGKNGPFGFFEGDKI